MELERRVVAVVVVIFIRVRFVPRIGEDDEVGTQDACGAGEATGSVERAGGKEACRCWRLLTLRAAAHDDGWIGSETAVSIAFIVVRSRTQPSATHSAERSLDGAGGIASCEVIHAPISFGFPKYAQDVRQWVSVHPSLQGSGVAWMRGIDHRDHRDGIFEHHAATNERRGARDLWHPQRRESTFTGSAFPQGSIRRRRYNFDILTRRGMFSAVRSESMGNRVSPGLAPSTPTSNAMDVMACDDIRQFFSTDLSGKAPLGFAAFFFDVFLLPPERRPQRFWVNAEVMVVNGGLLLFFASTLVDNEVTDSLGIAATSIASLAVLMLVVSIIFSTVSVTAVSTPDLTSVYAGCKMMGWALFYINIGTIMSFVAFVLSGLAKANGALIGWIVCGMGVALFATINIFFGLTHMALLPLPHIHQQGWYYQAFAQNIALGNYVMGRKSLREGADIQLTKMLAGPIPEDLRVVLDGSAKEV